VDAHLDIAWNAISAGRGFLSKPAPGYVISRSSLSAAGVGLVFATLYTAPANAKHAMRTRFVYENEHEARIMAVAEVNYYRSCELQLIGTKGELDAYVRGWKRGQVAATWGFASSGLRGEPHVSAAAPAPRVGSPTSAASS
jgi:hypothetical protein